MSFPDFPGSLACLKVIESAGRKMKNERAISLSKDFDRLSTSDERHRGNYSFEIVAHNIKFKLIIVIAKFNDLWRNEK